MKIEEITAKALKKCKVEDIADLRTRCVRMRGYMKSSGKDEISGVKKKDLIAKYRIVREEMLKRAMPVVKKTELDDEVDPRLLGKQLYGLDGEALRDFMVSENHVCLAGDFVKSPAKAKTVEVVIRDLGTNRIEKIEKALGAAIESESGCPVQFRYFPGGPADAFITIYDLVLRPRGPLSRVVAKAANEVAVLPMQSIDTACRQVVREKYDGWVCDYSDKEVIYDKDGKLYAVGYMYNEATKEVTLTGQIERVRRVVTYEREGAVSVLKSEEEPLEKIETTENYHRIPVRGKVQGHEIRTIEISAEKGIKALEDITDKEIVTYMFDVDKWSLEEAKTWAAEHKKKAAFVKIRKSDKAKQIVGGLVYEPDVVDTQGESTTAAEIEKAMYGFMEKYAEDNKRIKVMHKGEPKSFPILECFQSEEDTKKGGEELKKGAWWVTVKVKDEAVWKDIESGVLTGFSMGGTARAAK